MKKIYILLFLFVLLPINIKADTCTNEDMVKYQSLANNISYTYDFIEDQNSFNIVLSNLDSSLYIYDLSKNQNYYYIDSELALANYSSGSTYKFKIYSTNKACGFLKTIYINTPAYNSYYKDELCEGIEDYKYCKKWANVQVNYEKFKEEVISYKEEIEKSNEIIVEEEYKSIFDYILEYYIAYYYIGLPILIVLSLIYIIIKRRKDRLF